ncbi:SxtJ family membrane protein [Nitrospinaceae bacterium]|nr:SxtJ family membrane protein [Nitrospinaceae bacterium]
MHENLDREEETEWFSNLSLGITFVFIFLIIGILLIMVGSFSGWLFLICSILFLIVSLTKPTILTPLNLAWTKLGLLLSKIFNPIFLGVIFFLIITPIAIIRKIFGKSALRLKSKPSVESYWIIRNPPGPKTGSMTMQY